MNLGKFILFYSLILLIAGCKQGNLQKDINSGVSSSKKMETVNKISSESDSVTSIPQKAKVSEINKNQEKLGKISNSKFPLKYVFGIWTTDPNGPHADFRLDSLSWYIVDSAEDGNLPYLIDYDSLTIYSEGLKFKYRILKADKDSLILGNGSAIIRNVRWTN